MFYNTLTGYAYRYAVTMQCMKVTFSEDSRTEGASYDWVQIFYELDGKTYALPKLGGSDIKSAVVYVPATNFIFTGEVMDHRVIIMVLRSLILRRSVPIKK